MSTRTEILDYIKSPGDGPIYNRSNQRYISKTDYGPDDFDIDDLITKRIVLLLTPTIGELTIRKEDAGLTFNSGILTYTYQSGDSNTLGSIEPVANLIEYFGSIGAENKDPRFTYQDSDPTKAVIAVYWEGVDQGTWDNGTFKILLRSKVASANAITGEVQFKEVATYAEMITDGFTSSLIIYKVLADENQGGGTTQYNVWPSGVRILYGAGGSSGSAPYFTESTSGFKSKAYLNGNYPTAKHGSLVLQATENQQYRKLDDSAVGNWSMEPYQGFLS